MRNALRFYLKANWEDVFGSGYKINVEMHRTRLTTADYIDCLEILSEETEIPHSFKSLASSIFEDEENQGFKEMWGERYKKRTGKAMKQIMRKAVTRPYKDETTERNLSFLRKKLENVNFEVYSEVKSIYNEFESIVAAADYASYRAMQNTAHSFDD